LTDVESFSLILEPEVLLWNNRVFFYVLPVYAFVFSLSVAGFRWNKKLIKVSIFHKALSVTALLVFVLRIYTGELELEIIIYSFQIYSLFIFGLSFSFLLMTKYSKNKIHEFFCSKRKKYEFLDVYSEG